MPWRRRLTGAIGVLAVLVTLNTLRIASLLSASSVHTIERLHLIVWPIVIVLMLALFVASWIRVADRRGLAIPRGVTFAATAACLLTLYAATAPWTMTSPAVIRSGVWTVASGAALLQSVGMPATALGDVLTTPRGAFQVTPECLLTPLLPVSLAAILSMPWSVRRRLLAIPLVLSSFFALGIARLIALALPDALLASPLIVVHGFYQLAAGFVLLGLAAVSARRSDLRASGDLGHWAVDWTLPAAIAGAVVAAAAVGPAWAWLVIKGATVLSHVAPHAVTTMGMDAFQGALAWLPAYHLGLLTGFWIAMTHARRPGRAFVSVCLLAVADIAIFVVIGEARAHLGVVPHVLLIRAYAVAVPVVLAWLTFLGPKAEHDSALYRKFWDGIGQQFPVLTGAASTDYYFANETRLLSEHLAPLPGCRLLKSDLWDEAKNTQILQWAAAQGAQTFGIDLSSAIVEQARAAFGAIPFRGSIADVRRLPFGDNSFDAVYSMGTIEHFTESEAAVGEMLRVLRPGGRLVLGVPNRRDPFGRPILVAALARVGLYAYGFEKSYSRRQLRAMLQRAGAEVVEETGILFMPGWLRMLDLAGYSWCGPVTWLTRPAVAACAWVDRRVPFVRRHGYLLASVGVKRERQIHVGR
jgi:SAM-dependent methyltransferase